MTHPSVTAMMCYMPWWIRKRLIMAAARILDAHRIAFLPRGKYLASDIMKLSMDVTIITGGDFGFTNGGMEMRG